MPNNPEKVVVFDNGSLDTMDALGVGDKVVGAATSSLPEYLSSYKKVESAGGIKDKQITGCFLGLFPFKKLNEEKGKLSLL
ncbi:hypothetical protein EfmAA610_01150 [Enterococcus faecium]|nr:hypothetical protein EfmAA610_01150 [Enterococcus faecium]